MQIIYKNFIIKFDSATIFLIFSFIKLVFIEKGSAKISIKNKHKKHVIY